ncbi:hypothetical protein DJ568_15805 [Mucilaginibacter hurinus]|uniref:Uncharacterized protein n=1 Tax=Mucilaginibacter hurinus TaxID=2201324 RepID=A0A367GLY9_9SPHI|nr:DUF6428 family protein [Mucilaginibacter hurinus]RCH53703.1 hypothetical protein DJ568_15805 [Mucilaginibacter hurinus]
MNTSNIRWQEFKNVLLSHIRLNVQFEYAAGKYVAPYYHITEIKQALITSVDCGGNINSWTEIIIQLWEPANGADGPAMPADKILSIIQMVEKNLPLNPLAIVKIEYGNSGFDIRQMYPARIMPAGDELVVQLSPDITQCKAVNPGNSCGTKIEQTVCCTPASACC